MKYVVKTSSGYVVLARWKRGGYCVTWDIAKAYACSETQALQIVKNIGRDDARTEPLHATVQP